MPLLIGVTSELGHAIRPSGQQEQSMSRFSVLWWFIPVEALPLIVAAGGLLVMFRVITARRLLLFVAAFALLPVVIEPIIQIAFEVLPWWCLLVAVVIIATSAFRGIAALFIGERAADEMMGSLAASAVRATLRAAFVLPVQIVRGGIRLWSAFR